MNEDFNDWHPDPSKYSSEGGIRLGGGPEPTMETPHLREIKTPKDIDEHIMPILRRFERLDGTEIRDVLTSSLKGVDRLGHILVERDREIVFVCGCGKRIRGGNDVRKEYHFSHGENKWPAGSFPYEQEFPELREMALPLDIGGYTDEDPDSYSFELRSCEMKTRLLESLDDKRSRAFRAHMDPSQETLLDYLGNKEKRTYMATVDPHQTTLQEAGPAQT